MLLIKVAWGGKSLLVDFRPPGAVAKRGGVLGPYYTQMIDRVHYVLNNLATEFPGYTGGGYEIAGFGWHQGWNDQGQATSIYEDNSAPAPRASTGTGTARVISTSAKACEGANNVAITNEGATDHVVVTLAPLGTKGFVRLKVSQ